MYLSDKVNPLNIKELQESLSEVDGGKNGELESDKFIRCLSKCQMKFTDGEVDRLIDEIIKKEKQPTVNYRDFLKYSYLFQLFKNHLQLQLDLNKLDTEGKGLITVG